MIMTRALVREVLGMALAIMTVLFLLMLFVGITQALGQAALGGKTSSVVLKLFTLETIRALDTLLPLAVFLAVLLTVSRWYRDNEMTVLAACGISPMTLWWPLMGVAAGCAVIVGLASLYFSPLAAGQIERVKQQAASDLGIGVLKTGVFTPTQDGNGVIYIEARDEAHGTLKNIFIAEVPQERLNRDNNSKRPAGRQPGEVASQRIIFAKSGTQSQDVATREVRIELEQGHFYEGQPGQLDFHVVQFGRYLATLWAKVAAAPRTNIEAMSSAALWQTQNPREAAEWHWRLARPIAVFILVSVALVLAYTDPRRGRLAGLFVAILVFFLYSNVLGVAAGMIRSARVPASLGLWWVHAGFLAAAFYGLRRRVLGRPLIIWPNMALFKRVARS